ncbi:MAG: HAD-IB family hydrolase [Lentisphaerae bacterium]|nr:HAD-IB family hydrolase [Lentisphaerota bacterium]
MTSASPLIHIFDMDYTLIENDCDVSWKEFCVAEKLAPESDIQEADRFYQLYLEGKLDFNEFTRFQFREFTGNSPETMYALTRRHFEKYVKSKVRPQALNYVKELLAQGKRCIILTSTNEVIARPVAEYFGISEVYGSRIELVNGTFTGNLTGIYTAGEGKAVIARELEKSSGVPLELFAAYGDSINDLPLLKCVGFPHAVSPGKSLLEEAQKLDFTILNWSI